MNKIKDLYQQVMPMGGFILDEANSNPNENLFCYLLSSDKGSGFFWNYIYENMFVVSIQNFHFHEDFFLEVPEADFLAIQYYSSVSGEELQPYYQLSPNSLRAYVGGNNRTYQAVYHKNIPIQSVGISIMPDFYNNYLKDKFSKEYIDPANAFKRITLGMNYPQLVTLLKQIQNYSGTGMSAKLFYEGKILETIALIMDLAQKNEMRSKKIHITNEDVQNLKAVTNYLDHHFAYSISLEQLSKFTYMSISKLKSSFKEYYGCSISDYIIHKRINHSQHMLHETDLNISEIAKIIGYKRSDSFSKQFYRITGLLPSEYRNSVKSTPRIL